MLSLLYFQCFKKKAFLFLYTLYSLTLQKALKCQERKVIQRLFHCPGRYFKTHEKSKSIKKPQVAKIKLVNPFEGNTSGRWRRQLNGDLFSPLSPGSAFPHARHLHQQMCYCSQGLGQRALLLTLGPARSKPKQPNPRLSMLVLLLCHSFRSTNSKFLLRLGRRI